MFNTLYPIHSTDTKLKEIGIRKELGATGWSISWLFSKGFMVLIVIASMIALPIAYLLLDQIILASNFYRTSIGVLDMLASFVILMGITILTISAQTLKAARTNPAHTLRHQ